MKIKKILFLTLVFGSVLFFAVYFNVNAQTDTTVPAGSSATTPGTSLGTGDASVPQTGATSPTASTPQTGASSSNPSATLSGKGIEIPTNTGLPDPSGGIAAIIKNFLTWLLGIVGVIAIISFVISGIQYLTSAGDEDRMQAAKRNMLYAIVGVIVVLASFVIIQAIQFALEARSTF